MKNYTSSNLTDINPDNVDPGALALKIDNNVFIAGSYSISFYKCASVDAANQKWTGFKVIFANGVYSFAKNLTYDLSYSSVVPVIGGIYSENALIKIESLYQGQS